MYWTCSFDDEFSGTTLDTSKWIPIVTATSGYHSGLECYENTPTNITEGAGYLRLSMVKVAKAFTCKKPLGSYSSHETSGAVSSKYSQLYGMIQVRALFPSSTIQGLQSAIWMLPDNASKYGHWPRSGEIDIAENYSVHANLAIPTVHYMGESRDKTHTNNYCTITPGVFHTYNLIWTPTTMTFTYDGTVCLKDNLIAAGGLKLPAPFDQPFYLDLTQALGVGRNGLSSRTVLPASTYIDYVRMWK